MSIQPIADIATHKQTSLDPFLDLKRRVEITRDARFQANLRLERRQKASYFVISMLSLYVIILSLLPNIFKFSEREGQALLALTILNSVFIIITTFLEASGNFAHKGEQLHRSARKIAAVFNKLALLSDEERSDKEKIGPLQVEYQNALDECPFNHDNLDYDLIKARKPTLFNGRIYSGKFIWWVNLYRMIEYKFRELFWMAPHITAIAISTAVVIYILA